MFCSRLYSTYCSLARNSGDVQPFPDRFLDQIWRTQDKRTNIWNLWNLERFLIKPTSNSLEQFCLPDGYKGRYSQTRRKTVKFGVNSAKTCSQTQKTSRPAIVTFEIKLERSQTSWVNNFIFKTFLPTFSKFCATLKILICHTLRKGFWWNKIEKNAVCSKSNS